MVIALDSARSDRVGHPGHLHQEYGLFIVASPTTRVTHTHLTRRLADDPSCPNGCPIVHKVIHRRYIDIFSYYVFFKSTKRI
jgi:hypothetical protein